MGKKLWNGQVDRLHQECQMELNKPPKAEMHMELDYSFGIKSNPNNVLNKILP